MVDFISADPTLESYWRGIILLGRNSASYKFALAKSLLEFVQQGKDRIRLDELAIPFSRYVSEHLVLADKQGTSSSSRFLDSCRSFNTGQIGQTELIEATVALGFANVIDAFHNVNQDRIPLDFFIDERKSAGGILLTDELFKLQQGGQFSNFNHEVEARWRLVETAWSLNMATNLLEVHHDQSLNALYVPTSEFQRIDITSSRDALNGYQKGKCFYCYTEITIAPETGSMADVDHFFPHVLKQFSPPVNLDGIWNLVLSCIDCNRREAGKFAKVPNVTYLKRLHRRNEYLISSHHPLQKTLMTQTGNTEPQRHAFLQQMDRYAIDNLLHRWSTHPRGKEIF